MTKIRKLAFLICFAALFTTVLADSAYINSVWYNVYQIKMANENDAKAEIDTHFDKLKKLNVNRVFFLVKHPNGRGYYKSKIVKPMVIYNEETKKYQTLDWDVLDYVMKKGNEYGIEVFPYVNIFAEEGYFLEENKKFAEVKKDGKISRWSSPAIEDVVERNIAILKELVENYDVKGIQFDRVRYEDISSGYNGESIEKFKAIYQREPLSPKDREFVDFRKNNITQFVEKAYRKIKEIKPEIEVSAAVFHSPTTAAEVLQDWGRWVELGILDAVYTMSYTNDTNLFKKFIAENIEAYKKGNGKVKMIIGIGAYYKNMTPEILSEQLKICFEKEELSGVCWFSAYNLFEDRFYNAVINVDYENKMIKKN